MAMSSFIWDDDVDEIAKCEICVARPVIDNGRAG